MGDDPTVLVTGGTSGIGRALAARLATAGATVILAARDAELGATAVREIVAVTNNPRVHVLPVDLASQASIRDFCTQVKDRFERLDALANVAGLFSRRRTLTSDGLEMMFGVNHLAPFLVTNLLLDRLRASGAGRVLTVSAPSTVRLDFDDLQGERRFGALRAFGASKAANLLFTFELARRLAGSGVVANAVHPGLARTGLMRDAVAPMRWVLRLRSAPPERAAAEIAPLLVSPDFAQANGAFFHRGREIDPPPYTRDPEVGRRLWEVSATLTGLA
jgi:NAD(P)-dependent dehydrogenase (short-subunit alcohol dehydrogenase family)